MQVIVDDHTAKAVLYNGTKAQAIKAWRNGETRLKLPPKTSLQEYENQFIQVRKVANWPFGGRPTSTSIA